MLKKWFIKIINQELDKRSKVNFDFWETIQTKEGSWYSGNVENITSYCLCEIQYNKAKDSYRVKTSGDNPEKHGIYRKCAIAVSQLNSQKYEMSAALNVVQDILNSK